MESLLFIVISTLMLTGHSLAVSHVFKKNKSFNPTTLLIFSVSPAFVVSLIWSSFLSYALDWTTFALILLKNVLYAIILFLRIESFKRLGAYGGAILLIMQPIAIALFAWILLGEELTFPEISFAMVTLAGTWIASTSNIKAGHPIATVFRYVAIPAVLAALVAIVERYVLLGKLSAIDFFVFDKLVMLPTFLVAYFFCLTIGLNDAKIDVSGIPRGRLLVIFTVLGGLWGLSTLFYVMALELEKTMWVTMIRSLSFPLVALIGSFLDEKPLGRVSLIGLGLASAGSLLFALR